MIQEGLTPFYDELLIEVKEQVSEIRIHLLIVEYTLLIAPLRRMVIFLVDFLELVSDAILMRPSSYSKLRNAIENLSNEEWFRELYKEPRYNRAIWYNKDIKKILLVPMNIEMMKKDEEKAKQFIELVKKCE